MSFWLPEIHIVIRITMIMIIFKIITIFMIIIKILIIFIVRMIIIDVITTSPYSSEFLYSLPEDPKYILKKNSLLRKIWILINGGFYSLQVPHNCLMCQISSLVCLQKCNWNCDRPVCKVYILYSLTQPSSQWESHANIFFKIAKCKTWNECGSEQKRLKRHCSEMDGVQIEVFINFTARE